MITLENINKVSTDFHVELHKTIKEMIVSMIKSGDRPVDAINTVFEQVRGTIAEDPFCWALADISLRSEYSEEIEDTEEELNEDINDVQWKHH